MAEDQNVHGNRPDGERVEGLLRRPLSRARFLGLLGLGIGGLYLGWKAYQDFWYGWRINTVERPTPAFDPTTYRLVVDGLVEEPLTLTYDELLALPSVEQVNDFHCVEGWRVDDVRWQGVPMSDIIQRVRPKPEAGYVNFHSMTDVYMDSLSLHQASFPEVLLAYRMDGEPLTQDHGFPLRLIMPRMYGYKGPKWLHRIEFVPFQEYGYWEQRGWDIEAWIR
jgi:DMSO/TMAO reductase YedYZ molybdopterin-dependent catalytic subunit